MATPQQAMRRYVRGARRRLGRDYERYDGVKLPPRNIRYCTADFQDDAVFLESGRTETERLTELGLGSSTRILEIGCGPGRLPIGIIRYHGDIGGYDGVDIDERAISWCRRHISSTQPNYRFHVVDAQHDRYRPDGKPMDQGFALPFADESFDIIYLHSVFANMIERDIRIYAKEFARLLKPDAVVFLTAFVEEGVPAVTVNPDDYVHRSSGALNVARYERGFLLEILSESGLEVRTFNHGTELGGQSALELVRSDHPGAHG